MFKIRPDRPWFQFGDEPLEDLPGFRMNADGTLRTTSPGDLSTAFPWIDPGDSAALPGGIMFNVQPGQNLPGLHNFRPPEERVPGFRVNADGSMRDASTPPARLHPSIGGNPPGAFDQFGTNPFTSVGVGTLPPYLVHGPGLFNGLGRVPADDDEGEPGGTSLPWISNSPFPSGSGVDGFPIMASPSSFPSSRPDPGDELPSTTSLSYTAKPAASPLQPVFGPPPSEDGSSRATTDLGNGAVLPEWPASDGPRSAPGRTADPNIVRVGDGDSVKPTANVQIAQAPEKPQSKLRKDPSPGVVVALPDRSTIHDPQSPTGQLMAPTADLSEVAAAGRRAKGTLDDLSVFPPAYLAYLAGTLGANVAHGGTFDYQRRGNMITGYTQLPQFQKVSNLNVGLFAQQAGISLEAVLKIAGEFARHRSSNAKEGAPYGLDPIQLEFITLGYKIGESGMFDRPPIP